MDTLRHPHDVRRIRELSHFIQMRDEKIVSLNKQADANSGALGRALERDAALSERLSAVAEHVSRVLPKALPPVG